MACGVSRYSMAAGPSGGQKSKGETPTEEFVTGSTVSRPSRRVQELFKRCCSCTRHSTCSTTGTSAHVCECHNAGQQCTGCYCWGKCRNKGRLMSSPTTTRGLLGIFPRGPDLPATNPSATTLPVQPPTSLSLRAISAAESWERGARGMANSRKGPREEGERRAGEGRWKGGAAGRPRGEADMGRRKTTAQGRTMVETERGRRVQYAKVIRDRDRGGSRKRGRGGFGRV